MTDKGYVLDTGVFIEGHRRWYNKDIVPGFWDALLHFHGTGRLCSLDRCRDEIKEGDALADWVEDAPDELFVTTADAEVATKYAKVMAWAAGADFTDAAKAEFASVADGWLVAYGSVHDLIVVTHETHEAARKNRVKVPNACDEFGVEWLDTFEMLRQLEVKFDWQVPSQGEGPHTEVAIAVVVGKRSTPWAALPGPGTQDAVPNRLRSLQRPGSGHDAPGEHPVLR